VQCQELDKARAVASHHQNALVIAADTFIVFKGKILETINGKTHSVITGLIIIDTETNKALSRLVETKVYIRKLTLGEIDAYVRSKEPLDKAGGLCNSRIRGGYRGKD